MTKPKKKSSKWIIWTLAILLVLLMVVAAIKARKKPKGESVETEKVALREIREIVSASGKIFPEKEIKISSDVSGEIVELYVEEGDSVKAGQILAKIDPEAYVSAVERANASVSGAKSEVSRSKSAIENSTAQIEQIKVTARKHKANPRAQQETEADGVISAQDFENSESTLLQLEANLRSAEATYRASQQSAQSAQFNVASAEASLKEIKTSLSRTTITAPTAGIISKLNVEQGERVVGTIQMTGTEMMRIANFNSMEVQVEVSENDILRVSVGDTATIEVDAYLDKKFKGVVTEMASSAANTGATQVLTSDQVTNFVVKIRILPGILRGHDTIRKCLSVRECQRLLTSIPIQKGTSSPSLSRLSQQGEKEEGDSTTLTD